jgi:spore coat polysaccharide biosynthesis protein SpsF (cytidylyltransferase family)
LATDLAGRAVECFKAAGKGYLACCMPYMEVADGWDVEMFDYDTLSAAAAYATKREHVTTWMREQGAPWTFPTPHLLDYSKLKLSVDTREDLAVVDKVMAALDDPKDFGYKATARAWRKVMA